MVYLNIRMLFPAGLLYRQRYDPHRGHEGGAPLWRLFHPQDPEI